MSISISPTRVIGSAHAEGGDLILTIDVVQDTNEPYASEHWQIRSQVDWLVPSAPAGVGPSKVIYKLLPNRSHAPRTGTMTVNGQVLTVVQKGKWHVHEF
jgi:hypothetical protein